MNGLNLNEEKNELLGELDYLNCFIGLAKSFVKDRKIKKILTDIQNDIFVIQANTANPENVIHRPPNIGFDHIISLQKETYWIERNLKQLNNFVMPEGNTDACFLHCVRTIARQVERKLLGYLNEPTIVAQYFDCVACLMFALARFLNKKGGNKEQSPKYFTERDYAFKKETANKRRHQ